MVMLMVMVVMLMLLMIMVVVMMLMLLMIMVVVMMFVFLMIMVVMMMFMFLIMAVMVTAHRTHIFFRHQFLCQGNKFLHSAKDLYSRQIIPRRGNDRGFLIFLTDHGYGCIQLILTHILRSAQDDRAGALHLIVIKLAKVLHIHFYFLHVCHSHQAVHCDITVLCHILHRAPHI